MAMETIDDNNRSRAFETARRFADRDNCTYLVVRSRKTTFFGSQHIHWKDTEENRRIAKEMGHTIVAVIKPNNTNIFTLAWASLCTCVVAGDAVYYWYHAEPFNWMLQAMLIGCVVTLLCVLAPHWINVARSKYSNTSK